MKNTILKTIGTMWLAILMLTAFTQISVFAQEQEIITEDKSDEQTQEEDLSARRSNARRLEGVWNIQVTGRNCQTGDIIRIFPAMHTYMRGGTMSDWGTGTPPSLRSNGQGVWSYQSRRRYSAAFQFFRFNTDGTYAGKQIGRSQITLSYDGNSFTTISTGQVLDAGGNVIANACNTSTATRFE